MLSQTNLVLKMLELKLQKAGRFKAVLMKKRGLILTIFMQLEMFLRMFLSSCQLHKKVGNYLLTEFMTELLEKNLKRK
jgi:hypothetical protein